MYKLHQILYKTGKLSIFNHTSKESLWDLWVLPTPLGRTMPLMNRLDWIPSKFIAAWQVHCCTCMELRDVVQNSDKFTESHHHYHNGLLHAI